MSAWFKGGPLAEGREFEIHSLVVHAIGDGRDSVGHYRQVYVEGVPQGVFEWYPADE